MVMFITIEMDSVPAGFQRHVFREERGGSLCTSRASGSGSVGQLDHLLGVGFRLLLPVHSIAQYIKHDNDGRRTAGEVAARDCK
ncbi:Syncephapepsin [Dissostichus eleginoides]|uniref:Syncephapepsin n=1 Tax=Dissostichus eleginoides TaxID=100907 RepID=A0AAD9BVF0_DISEL|nr:Syncephapepsin [Dissostichus eleginoides]